MAKSDMIEVQGVVIDKIPGGKFKVKLDNEVFITCHVTGKLRQNFISIIVGDKVTVEISPYDLTKGIIVWRDK